MKFTTIDVNEMTSEELVDACGVDKKKLEENLKEHKDKMDLFKKKRAETLKLLLELEKIGA